MGLVLDMLAFGEEIVVVLIPVHGPRSRGINSVGIRYSGFPPRPPVVLPSSVPGRGIREIMVDIYRTGIGAPRRQEPSGCRQA